MAAKSKQPVLDRTRSHDELTFHSLYPTMLQNQYEKNSNQVCSAQVQSGLNSPHHRLPSRKLLPT